MIHCAYNSLWMGQIIQPDWDMFQSDHLCAKFHAGSRAICGGPVYVSDSLGGHDFDLLSKLVFPDSTIPKCVHFALPTRDCIFKNPLFDSKTILKIWNINKVIFVPFRYVFGYFTIFILTYVVYVDLAVRRCNWSFQLSRSGMGPKGT